MLMLALQTSTADAPRPWHSLASHPSRPRALGHDHAAPPRPRHAPGGTRSPQPHSLPPLPSP
eukprot:scaffold59072_cov72-Phaeocystis_antarctica.AAC.4